MLLEFRKGFKKQLHKLPRKIQERFFERLRAFAKDRFDQSLNNHAVDAAFPGCRSINITGDYRAIFYEKSETAIFIKIGKHGQLYS